MVDADRLGIYIALLVEAETRAARHDFGDVSIAHPFRQRIARRFGAQHGFDLDVRHGGHAQCSGQAYVENTIRRLKINVPLRVALLVSSCTRCCAACQARIFSAQAGKPNSVICAKLAGVHDGPRLISAP